MRHLNQVRFTRPRRPQNRIQKDQIPCAEVLATPGFNGNAALVLSLTSLAALAVALIRA
jgi:hypothetical protein